MESNEIEQLELQAISKPKSKYWTRLMESLSDYGLQVKNEVAEAMNRVKRRPSINYNAIQEPSSSRAMLLDQYESQQRPSYGSVMRSNQYNSHNNESSTYASSRSRSSSNTSTNTNASSCSAFLNSNEVITVNKHPESLYPIILVNDEFQASAPTSPSYYSSNNGKPAFLTIPPVINHFNAEAQDFNYLTVEPMPGGAMSPGGKSSGFLSNESGCPSPAPTMNSSFELPGGSSQDSSHGPEIFTWGRMIKIGLLTLVLILVVSVITLTSETQAFYKQISVSKDHPLVVPVELSQTIILYYPILTILAIGPFAQPPYDNYTNDRLIIYLQKKNKENEIVETFNTKWELPIFVGEGALQIPTSKQTHGFDLREILWDHDDSFSIVFTTNTETFFPFTTSGRLLSGVVNSGVIFGGAVMVGLYILIIFELVNRTLAAMMAAAASIGALSYLNERPTTEEMVDWLDMDTLILLFSMMVMVALLCETGFFDYAAFMMYKLANGRVWTLITGLCMFTAIVSAFLDNVTTILLMTPTTIRICEAMELNPVPVLISIVIFSNIGGAITPVGDPPNVIIANNKEVIDHGIDFATFSLHMMLGIIPVIIIGYFHLRIIFRDIKSLKFSEPYEIAELRREIDVWTRAADSLTSYSKDESHVRTLLLSKILHLRNKLKVKVKLGGQSEENYKANLAELEASCKIRDWTLLIKCGIVLTFVMLMFFLHSVPQINLSMGWTALLGAVFLLLLADRRELEGIFSRVEWSTLIFFSALFVVMEGVSRLGLLEWIGGQTEAVILNVNEESRLTVAVLLILWVSGIASAFIDNIPFTTMMIQIVTRISERVNLPLQPLIWALAFGTCLGGNGTLIGASANVVCAGLADQHGYRFTFMDYFRIGFPMMIVSLIVSTVYLLICHSLLGWNY